MVQQMKRTICLSQEKKIYKHNPQEQVLFRASLCVRVFPTGHTQVARLVTSQGR